jgi:hypothetical protein
MPEFHSNVFIHFSLQVCCHCLSTGAKAPEAEEKVAALKAQVSSLQVFSQKSRMNCLYII